MNYKLINKYLEKYFSEVAGAVFFTILILLGYFTMIKRNITVVEEPRYLPVILESAESLKIGSNVTLLGVPVGIIGSLHYVLLDPGGRAVILEQQRRRILKREKKLSEVRGQFVVAVLDLRRNLEIYENYNIVSQYPSLFSVKTVDIRPGRKESGEDPLNVRYLSLEEVLELRTKQKIPKFSNKDVVLHADNFGDPLFLLTDIIAENQTQLRKIVRNAAEISDKINRGDGNLAMLLNQKGMERDAVELLLTASVLSHELEEGLEAYRETGSLIDSLKTLFFLLLAGI